MKKTPLPVQNMHRSDKNVPGKKALAKLLRCHDGHADFRGKQFEAIEAFESVMVIKEKCIADEYLSSTQAIHVRNKKSDEDDKLGVHRYRSSSVFDSLHRTSPQKTSV